MIFTQNLNKNQLKKAHYLLLWAIPIIFVTFIKKNTFHSLHIGASTAPFHLVNISEGA